MNTDPHCSLDFSSTPEALLERSFVRSSFAELSACSTCLDFPIVSGLQLSTV